MLVKTGRPKSENPKNIRFTFRMDSDEEKVLNKICEITCQNKNEVIRVAIIKYYEYLTK